MHRDGWMAFRSHFGTGRVVGYHAELWPVGLAFRESVRKRDTLQTHGVKSGCLQRLAGSHPVNRTPGALTRAVSSQMDQPEREDPLQGRY